MFSAGIPVGTVVNLAVKILTLWQFPSKVLIRTVKNLSWMFTSRFYKLQVWRFRSELSRKMRRKVWVSRYVLNQAFSTNCSSDQEQNQPCNWKGEGGGSIIVKIITFHILYLSINMIQFIEIIQCTRCIILRTKPIKLLKIL